MTADEFWSIIERSRRGAEDCDEIGEKLEGILRGMTADQIIAFAERLNDALAGAYSWDLWGAAYIINGGCSDDGFEYFRGWLISKGRRVYEKALSNPDGLAGIAEPDAECEAILYAPYNAWREVAGSEDYPTPESRQSPEPSGARWVDDADLETRFPELTKAFG